MLPAEVLLDIAEHKLAASFSHAQVLAFARNEMRMLAEEIEAGFATRDTNDGSTYCSHCGAPQPKRRTWVHDPMCIVTTIRERALQAPSDERPKERTRP